GLKQILLKPPDDRISVQQIENGRMTLEDLRATLFLVGRELGHVAFGITQLGQPFGAISNSVSLHLLLGRRNLPLKHVIKKFFGCVSAVDVLRRPEQFQSETVTVGWKQIVASSGEPVDHFRATHLLWPPPSIEIAISLERKTVLFYAHVTHLHFTDELVHRHSFGPL